MSMDVCTAMGLSFMGFNATENRPSEPRKTPAAREAGGDPNYLRTRRQAARAMLRACGGAFGDLQGDGEAQRELYAELQGVARSGRTKPRNS